MNLPWGIIEWVIQHPELGWIVLFFWLLFELRHPKGRVHALDRKITGAIIVIRALARREDAINEKKVDDYLVENGMEPGDFFVQGDGKSTPKHLIEDSSETSGESPLTKSDNTPNNDGDTTE